ncbi:DNA polymerase I [Aster yellows witches'-broom phytoplasma AYWB]|uniref:5'-3' exonuclease n=1 Tax=Aster yellows witches'-broom phytoplasma (strain AYWB) TaxID=322098 RepID=Q2NK60_AYWBP|nr:5'-3' exonuclease H3TH domain-containing protein [Aster yellows witches'-broom phytoplasma]ABC65183.1 DNA polymerase I [Aster yellows witches'-broom phytoplasma AYWB]
MKHLVLVDGNSLLFRAYHATASKYKPLLQNKKGIYTNALLSFIRMFEKILEETKGYILVAFDTPKTTKRHQLYDAYKQGRPETPSALISQIPLIKQYLELIGVKYHAQDEYEADDIIGTLAKEASNQNNTVSIYSSDCDLLQLVDKKITVCLLKKGLREIKYYTPTTLLEEYGLKEYQMIDYKSLIGDPSDNIKGVLGIGPKTAQKLLQEYDTLDNLMQNLDNIKPILKTKIQNSQTDLELSKILTAINLKVPLPFDCMQTEIQIRLEQNLKNFYEEMDFRRLAITKYARIEKEINTTNKYNKEASLKAKEVQEAVKDSNLENDNNLNQTNQIRPIATTNNNDNNTPKVQEQGAKTPQINFHYQIIKDQNALNTFLDQIQPHEIWACFFELEKENDSNTFLQGIGFSNGNAHFFIDANLAFANNNFCNYLKDANFYKIVFHNQAIQFFLKTQHQQLNGVIFDLICASYLLFPLKNLEFSHIISKIDILNNTNYVSQLSQKILILEQKVAFKSFLLHAIKNSIFHYLKAQNQLFLFQEIELPLSNVLAQLEYETNLLQQKQIIEANPIEKNIYEKIEMQQEKIPKTNQMQEQAQEKDSDQNQYTNLKNNQEQENQINQLKSLKDVFGYQNSFFLNMTKNKKTYNYLINDNFFCFSLKILATLGNIQKIKNYFKIKKNHLLNDEQTLHFFVNEPTSEIKKDSQNLSETTNFCLDSWIKEILLELNISSNCAQDFINQYLSLDDEIINYYQNLLQQIKEKKYALTLLKRKVFFGNQKLTPNLDLETLYVFLQENILDMKKIAILQLLRHLERHNENAKITYFALNNYLQQHIDLISKHLNYFFILDNGNI